MSPYFHLSVPFIVRHEPGHPRVKKNSSFEKAPPKPPKLPIPGSGGFGSSFIAGEMFFTADAGAHLRPSHISNKLICGSGFVSRCFIAARSVRASVVLVQLKGEGMILFIAWGNRAYLSLR